MTKLMKSLRPMLLLVAAVSFGLGISLPLMRFEKLFFFAETPSLLDIIAGLWVDNETLLALVVINLFYRVSTGETCCGFSGYP